MHRSMTTPPRSFFVNELREKCALPDSTPQSRLAAAHWMCTRMSHALHRCGDTRSLGSVELYVSDSHVATFSDVDVRVRVSTLLEAAGQPTTGFMAAFRRTDGDDADDDDDAAEIVRFIRATSNEVRHHDVRCGGMECTSIAGCTVGSVLIGSPSVDERDVLFNPEDTLQLCVEFDDDDDGADTDNKEPAPAPGAELFSFCLVPDDHRSYEKDDNERDVPSPKRVCSEEH